MDFLLRVVFNAFAVAVAVLLVGGLEVDARTAAGKAGTYLVVGLVFGVVNATIRPVAKVISFPFVVLTLGLFALVVNALLFWLSAGISGWFGVPFRVDGFWAAFWGAIVVGLVSWLLSLAIRRD